MVAEGRCEELEVELAQLEGELEDAAEQHAVLLEKQASQGKEEEGVKLAAVKEEEEEEVAVKAVEVKVEDDQTQQQAPATEEEATLLNATTADQATIALAALRERRALQQARVAEVVEESMRAQRVAVAAHASAHANAQAAVDAADSRAEIALAGQARAEDELVRMRGVMEEEVRVAMEELKAAREEAAAAKEESKAAAEDQEDVTAAVTAAVKAAVMEVKATHEVEMAAAVEEATVAMLVKLTDMETRLLEEQGNAEDLNRQLSEALTERRVGIGGGGGGGKGSGYATECDRK